MTAKMLSAGAIVVDVIEKNNYLSLFKQESSLRRVVKLKEHETASSYQRITTCLPRLRIPRLSNCSATAFKIVWANPETLTKKLPLQTKVD